MARRGSPALYELLGRSRDSKGSGGSGSGGSPIPKVQTVIPINVPPRKQGGGMQIGSKAALARAAGDASGARGAGPASSGPAVSLDPRVLRIGGVAVLGVALLVGVYLLGVSRGSSNSDGDSAQPSGGEQLNAVQPIEANRASTQPEVAAAAPVRSAPQRPAANPSNGGASENPTRAAAPDLDPNRDPSLGPPLPPATKGVDPRQAGLQYCVIASVLEANADKLVQFCRERGLDAWVVPDHNGRLREITVLPGLPKSELKGAAATALDARIRKVGALWKAAGRGNSDFEDRYFKPFNG